jgi:hypothetical protein
MLAMLRAPLLPPCCCWTGTAMLADGLGFRKSFRMGL